MANYKVEGPAVAAVGWIPYAPSVGALPAPHVYTPDLATRLVFNSGNAPPPTWFIDSQVFQMWLRSSRAYRGALWLFGASIEWSDANPRPRLRFRPGRDFGKAGYTPPRLIARGVDLTPPPLRHQYIPGPGGPEPPVVSELPGAAGFTVRLRVRFKLSYMTDVLGRVLTGHWAPNAWMEITYRIEKSGAVSLSFDGSTIPSQNYYVDWTLRGEYDMVQNSELQLRGFLETDDYCAKAPRRGTPSPHLEQRPVVVV